jgi:hypothetical protein
VIPRKPGARVAVSGPRLAGRCAPAPPPRMSGCYTVTPEGSQLPPPRPGHLTRTAPAPGAARPRPAPAVARGLALVLCLLAAGCLAAPRLTPPDPSPDRVGRAPGPSLAVLPFINHTTAPGLEDFVRVSFYSHLSARPFADIEPQRVDLALDPPPTSTRLEPDQVRAIGARLQADLLVSGDLLAFERVYAGLYSHISMEVSIVLYECRNGRSVWSDSYEASSHEGGIPLSLLEIPLIGLRTGLNLREKEKIQLVDELTRHLSARIPYPGTRADTVAAGPPAGAYEVQVGAFLDGERAREHLAGLRQRGLPVYLRAEAAAGGGTWHRLVLGPYESQREAVQKKETVRKQGFAGAFVRRVSP